MKPLWLVFLLCPSLLAQSAISRAEYYFDTDPGFGQATAFAVSSGTDVTLTFDADIGPLSPGIHVLYVRAMNDSGWSLPFSRTFLKESLSSIDPLAQIVAAEYYIDDDPGFGLAASIEVADSVNTMVDFTVDLTGLPNGLHELYVRAMDNHGAWTLVFQRPFLKDNVGTADLPPNVVAAEYYVDTDPGFGNGTAISLTPDDDLQTSFVADLSGLANGLHFIYVRAMDASKGWSVIFTRPFLKDGVGVSEAPPNIVAAEYFVDEDPGFGSGSPISFEEGPDLSASFSASLIGLENGLHTVYARVVDGGGNWSHAFSRPVLKEAVGVSDIPPDITRIDYAFEKHGVTTIGGMVTDFPVDPDVTVEFCAHLDSLDEDSTYTIAIRAFSAAGAVSATYRHSFLRDSSAVILNKAPHLIGQLPDINLNEDFDSLIVGNLTTVFSDSNIKLCNDSLRFTFELSGEVLSTAMVGTDLVVYSLPNVHGSAVLTVTATDDSGATISDEVTVTVAPVNDLPVASDESVTLLAGPNHTITVLRNDADVDGDVLSIAELVAGPAHGSASLGAGDSTINYSATITYSGPDQIVYRISDGQGGVDTATVAITVTPARPLVLSTSVLQNPVLSKYADLYVVADTSLQAVPQVKLFVGSDSSTVTMAATATARIYKGAVEFTGNGIYTIRTTGLSVNGLSSVGTRSFSVSLAKPGLASMVTSVDGNGRVLLDRTALTVETWLLAQEVIVGGDPAYQFGPMVDLKRPAELNLHYSDETRTDPSKLFVYQWDGAAWKQLPSRVYPNERMVRSTVPQLGQFKIGYDPTFTGTNIVPETFALKQNYPNPFNPSTTIAYDLAEDSELKLSIFNLLGQQVKVLHSGPQLAGSYRVVWDGRNDRGERVASGIYFYRMQTKAFVRTQKMILLK